MERSKRLRATPGGVVRSREHDLKVFGVDADALPTPKPALIRAQVERGTGRTVALIFYYKESDALRSDGTGRLRDAQASAPGFVEVHIPVPEGHVVSKASAVELAPAFAP